MCNNETLCYESCCLPNIVNRDSEIALGNKFILDLEIDDCLKPKGRSYLFAKCIFLGIGKVLLRMKRNLTADMCCMKWSYCLKFVQRTAEEEITVKSFRYAIRKKNVRRSRICSESMMMMMMMTTTVRVVTMMKTERPLLCGSVNSMHIFTVKDLNIGESRTAVCI